MNRPHWVKASVITDLTGWDGDRLKKARTDGSLKSRTDRGKKVWYDLNSLHPYHLKSKETIINTDTMNQEYETIRKILNAATADAGRLEDAVTVLKEYANSKVQEALENVLLTEPTCQP